MLFLFVYSSGRQTHLKLSKDREWDRPNERRMEYAATT